MDSEMRYFAAVTKEKRCTEMVAEMPIKPDGSSDNQRLASKEVPKLAFRQSFRPPMILRCVLMQIVARYYKDN